MRGGTHVSTRARQFAARVAGPVVVVVLAVACSGASSGGSGGSASSSARLRLGYDFASQFTDHFDPGKSTGNCDSIVLHQIYDSLLHRDANGKLLPGLAQSWDIAPDGSSVTLTLRPNLTFQDDTPLDANAVKAGLLHNKLNPQLNTLHNISSIEVLSPAKVKVNFSIPQPYHFLYAIAGGADGMIVASNSLKTADSKPVGAGPFKFDSYSPGSKVSLTRWNGYYDKGTFKFGGIDFTQAAVGPPSVTALQSGAVDMVSVQAESYPRLSKASGYAVAVQPTTAYLQFEFRNTKPFDNVKVRQAVAYAIDRDQINKIVNEGKGEVASQAFPKSSPAYDPSLAGTYTYDPAKAKELMREAGYPNGLDVDMVIPGGNIASMERQGALVQQQLAAIGIRAKIIRINGSDIATNYYLNQTGNAFVAAELGNPFPTDNIDANFAVGSFVAIWDHFENPQITALDHQALAQTDFDKAMSLTKQAEKIVVDNAMEVPIAFTPQFEGYSTSKVGGTVRAQTDICDPPDLSAVTVKG